MQTIRRYQPSLYKYYTHLLHQNNSTYIIHHFDAQIIQNQLALFDLDSIVPVFDACKHLKDIHFATKVWDYITVQNKTISKPNQLLYSKLLGVYAKAQESEQTEAMEKSMDLVSVWIQEYQEDHIPLQKGLKRLSIHSPVILNQMIRMIMEWNEKEIAASSKSVMRIMILFYFDKMIQLNIVPDRSTMNLMSNQDVLNITALEYVKFMDNAKNEEIKQVMEENLLHGIVPKINERNAFLRLSQQRS